MSRTTRTRTIDNACSMSFSSMTRANLKIEIKPGGTVQQLSTLDPYRYGVKPPAGAGQKNGRVELQVPG